ncbi:hypothetical protein [Streptomyces sp. NBC_00273]|uniref:hypothetical protein n=1 Tax=Streptomyces sp. NBC_00273 TaxID=2903644 RepID=UPI002E28FE05|nr:hypothetical protein [Streptomyces sp. NBC_00273]
MTQTTGQEGGEEKERPPSRTVKLGVVVTIVASIVGLITTGVATLFSALVAHDQLDQSQQVAEERQRAQAARVSYWGDLQPDGTPRLHLMNRSPDPISNVHMFFAVEVTDTAGRHLVSFTVVMQGLPPCSDLTFTLNDMRYKISKESKPAEWSSPSGDLPADEWLNFTGTKNPLIVTGAVEFADRDGVDWQRLGGRLTRDAPPVSPTVESWGVVHAVAPRPLKGCAEDPSY